MNALAGMIYASLHPEIELKPQEPPPRRNYPVPNETDQFYVDFYHTEYKEFERYPFDLLNVVGY